jgi:TolB-like protein/Flp pilus assembly protein TadD
LFSQQKLSKIGFEANYATVGQLDALHTSCKAINLQMPELIPLDDVLANIRKVKDDNEVDLIRKSVALAEEAFVAVRDLYTGQLGNSQLPEKLKQFSRKQATARRVKRTAIVALLFLAIALPAGAFLFFRWMPPAFSRGQGSIPEKSIAVLPFENAGGNPDTEYLSDGIPDALINSLTELQQVKVIARTTAAHYRGKDIDPREIGRQLNVRAVLMGTVRENDKMLNVQVDLVDTLTGAQLRGQQYDRQLSDLISVKQTIVREVTEKLRWRLSGEQQQQLVRHDTTNAEAYQSYLRGRYYWNKRTGEALNKAIEEFQHAIDRDPGYALAYGGLADSYLLLEQYAGVPARESLPKARAAIDRALQIDDSLAEAHTSSALTYYASWRWAEAEKEFGRAIALNPNYPTAHLWFAYYLYVRGRFNEAMREITSAHQLDPLSPVIGENIALGFLFKNDLTAAVEQCLKVIALDRSFADVHHILGYAYLKQQRIDDATGEFQKAVDLSGRAGRYLSELGYCYAVTGKQTQAFPILDELKQKYANRQATGQFVAGVYAGLGDNDQAFAWLEKDFQQRSGQLPTTTWRFEFEQLRKDSRFRDLVGRMGLEP